MKSFRELYEAVQEFTGEYGDQALSVIKRAINTHYKRLISSQEWGELFVRDDSAYSVAAGTNYLALPGDAEHLIYIGDLTNQRTIRKKSPRNLDADNIDNLSAQGSVIYFSELGRYPIFKPIAAASKIAIYAESTADVSIPVRVHGTRSSPKFAVGETVTTHASDGTTEVQSANTFLAGWSLDRVGTDNPPTSGFLAIKDVTAGEVIGHIPPNGHVAQYYIIQFENPTDAAISVVIHYKKRVDDLQYDSDTLLVPSLSESVFEATLGTMRQYDRKYNQSQIHMGEAVTHLRHVMSERGMQGHQVHDARPAVPNRGSGPISGY